MTDVRLHHGISLVAMTIVVTTSCVSTSQAVQPSSAEDLAVFASAIEHEVSTNSRQLPRRSYALLVNRTVKFCERESQLRAIAEGRQRDFSCLRDSTADFIMKPSTLVPLSAEFRAAFHSANQVSRRIAVSPGPARLIRDGDVYPALRKVDASGTLKVLKRHPRSSGVMELSSPAYNSERTRAVVYVTHLNTGFLLHLEKQGSDWRVVSTTLVWES